jgi:hypothetical protein
VLEKKPQVIDALISGIYKRDADIARAAGTSREYVRIVRRQLGIAPRRQIIQLEKEEKKALRESVKANCLQRLKDKYKSEHTAYANAKNRCNNPNNAQYKRYGGRGIRFVFNDFREFMEHIGPKVSPDLTLDRIENEGNYEKGNIAWATRKEQCAPGKRRPRIKKNICNAVCQL